jgi:hypothetical protein
LIQAAAARGSHEANWIMVPIEDPTLRARLIDILNVTVADNVKSWSLRSDGSYTRTVPKAAAPLVRSQVRFMEITRDRVKGAEASSAVSGRFALQRSPAQVAGARANRRRERTKGKDVP